MVLTAAFGRDGLNIKEEHNRTEEQNRKEEQNRTEEQNRKEEQNITEAQNRKEEQNMKEEQTEKKNRTGAHRGPTRPHAGPKGAHERN